MMSTAQVLGVSGAMLLGAMAPGPDFVIVARNSMLSGRRAGMASAAGIALGVFAWAALSGLGVAGLLAASAIAFTVVKLAGAAYLLFLGIRALLAARRGGYEMTAELDGQGVGPRTAFRQGLLNNLLNPKAAVFFLALLPQFLPAAPALVDTAELALTATAVTLAWFLILALGIASLRHVFTRARVRRAIDAAMGTLLVALGVRIAVQTS
ncbi:LysE family transporter [Nocardia sp. CDC159]|uniref:LysE family transporter n=1 Tax=Nocardia pulmonis TaxID=2951408 RepID=A0A9X2E7W3_9NOCA|nr:MULTISPECIES: LysE family transporter [Nocardia]MCM6775236.1 LysE family transporter [Nocardia pulmonis]MCM6788030.1 LysE family transporter [Nocardia sp. CDC159]